MLAQAKTPGARARAQDRYDSLAALHDEAKWTSISVEDALKELCDPNVKRSYFALSTIHKAKGLEWPLVTYLHYDEEIQGLQESNIKYVGITRSKDRLILQGNY
jgi:superfamily I DNA/RNA helicase